MATLQFKMPQPAPLPHGPAPVARPTPEMLRQRAQPSVTDVMLSPAGRAWLESLDVRPRPEALCARYPRVANKLAAAWPDAEATDRLFDDLMVDRRGNRKGFPTPVLVELRLLHETHLARMPQRPVADAAWSHVGPSRG